MEWRDLLRNNDLGRYIEPLERYGVETLKHLADEDLLGDDDLRGEEIGMKTLQVKLFRRALRVRRDAEASTVAPPIAAFVAVPTATDTDMTLATCAPSVPSPEELKADRGGRGGGSGVRKAGAKTKNPRRARSDEVDAATSVRPQRGLPGPGGVAKTAKRKKKTGRNAQCKSGSARRPLGNGPSKNFPRPTRHVRKWLMKAFRRSHSALVITAFFKNVRTWVRAAKLIAQCLRARASHSASQKRRSRTALGTLVPPGFAAKPALLLPHQVGLRLV